MIAGSHVIRCRETGEALANKLDGGDCVCKPGECEMHKLRNREGDYAKKSEDSDSFDATGLAIGLATGFPISPRGITGGSILGMLLHPTERHAAYDVTDDSRSAARDVAPVERAARDPSDYQNSRVERNSDVVEPTQTAPAPSPSYTPSDPPSYTPSYTPDPSPSYTPDPSPSYDSGSSSFDSGGGGSGGSSD